MHRFGNIGINAKFVFANISIFLYLLHVDLISVIAKLIISGYERITFQGYIFLVLWTVCENLESSFS